MKSATLEELASLVDGTVRSDAQLVINGFNSLELASAGELTFINNSKLAGQLTETSASAAIVPEDVELADLPLIQVKNPDSARNDCRLIYALTNAS